METTRPQHRTPPHVRVLLRFLFLGTCALNVFLVPGVHGYIPMPAPNIVAFPQELSLSREWGEVRRYPDSDWAEIPILPELLAGALATLLWARLASPKFWRRGWIAFLLASVAGVVFRFAAPVTASIWWLPISTSTFQLLLGVVAAVLLIAGVKQEKKRSAVRTASRPA